MMPASYAHFATHAKAKQRDRGNQIAFHHAHSHCTAERPVKQTTDHQALAISQLSRKMRSC